MTGELWMCLVLAVLLVIVLTQNMGLRDRLGRLESRLEWMALGKSPLTGLQNRGGDEQAL
jgi:hypothetical protein